MHLARENPEMTHPLLAAYRTPSYSVSVMARAHAAQALYEKLPARCPECGNDDPEALSAGETPKGVAAWVCSDEERCFKYQDATASATRDAA